MSNPPLHPTGHVGGSHELKDFVGRVQQRVDRYLHGRPDGGEQADHLRHVADRTRWLYYSELQRANPGFSVRISAHEDNLIQACVLGHDIGKWIPREELQTLLPEESSAIQAIFSELKFSAYQSELFLLAVKQRLGLPQDGYSPEYDSAHHLVSAFLLVADPQLGFHEQSAADQTRLNAMIIGHQFGSYFKENLLNLSLRGVTSVTTGMLMDVSRPDRLAGDLLACAFHDADISDLLYVGSLERRPNREEVFHVGGLIKILMINAANRVFAVPLAPEDLAGCISSCQATVHHACKEFLTATAVEHGERWRGDASRFLTQLGSQPAYDQINSVLTDDSRDALERLSAVRVLARLQAHQFLSAEAAPTVPAG